MRYFLIVLFFAANLTAFSQSEPELASKALKAFQSKNYEEAVRDYMKLVSIQPRSTDYNYHYGVCLLKTAAIKKDAIKHLEFAAASDNVPVEAFFYLGKACHLDYQFKKAITYYQIFKTKKGSSVKNSEFDVDRELEMCQNGMKLLKDISDLVVEEKRDYSASEFYRLYDEKSLNGSILISNMDQTKTDKKNNHIPVIFYPNQPDLIFFSSYGEKDTGQKNIYFKRRTASGWSSPQLVSGEVNTEYDEDFPYYDEKKKILYFSSKGHNSMGGYDIFSAQYDPSTESFKNVRNLDFAISSTDDDLFYVPGADNTSAWFASARESKPGKMTIYKVAVERYPATIAFIKGIFESTAFKDNKRITLELINKRTNRKIGTYYTDDKGVYSIPLYFSRDYEYQLSIYGVNKVFPLKFTIPKLSNLTQYGQKIIHKRVDGVDYVELLFLPESEIRPDDEQLLEFIREMSTLDVSDGNVTQQDAASKTFSSLQSSIQKGAELLEGKLEMETKANQKIYNNIQTISSLQYELKNLVAKEDASSLTAQQLKEAKQKLVRIDALEQENKLLKALTDSMSLVNESVKTRLEIVKNLDKKLQILSGSDETALSSFKQENEGSFRLLETITAEKENDSFGKYETLKKQINTNVDTKRDLEAKLKEIQTELVSLNNKLGEAKGKEKISIEEQIASKTQQAEQITGEILYLDKKIDALQKERKTIEERKDLLMSVSQVSSTRQLSNEEITEELNKLESKNFKSIRNLLEEAYDRLLNPEKVEQLTLNDIQNGKLEQAWSQYQNIKGTDITSEQQEIIANYEKELQAETERISSKSTKTTEEQRYLNKLKTELTQVQNLREGFTEATQNNEPSGENYTTKQFVSELYPQMRSDLNQKLAGESEVAIEETFDKLLSKIEQQEKVQQKMVAANPKSKELHEEQNQLSQLKSELLKAKSDWKLAGLKAQTEQQTDNITKDRWIDEIDPEYNQELDRINEQEYENNWDKVIALKNKEEALLAKIKNKQNGVKSSGLEELFQEVESSVNQLKQRLQYVIDKEAEKSLNTSVSVQKAVKQLDFNLEKSVFEEQAADLQKVIEEEIAGLKDLKSKILREKAAVNTIDKAIESLEETLLLLESKQSEYEQLNSIAAVTSENNSSSVSLPESNTTTSEENVVNQENSTGTTAANQSENTSSAASQITSSTNSENNNSAISPPESNTTTSEENVVNQENPTGTTAANPSENTSSAASQITSSTNSENNNSAISPPESNTTTSEENVVNQENPTGTTAANPSENTSSAASQITSSTNSENNSSAASPPESKTTTFEENVVNQENPTGTTTANQSENTSSAASQVTSYTNSENNSSAASLPESKTTTSEENVTNSENPTGTTAANQPENTSSAASQVTSSTNSENNSSSVSPPESKTTTSEENVVNQENPTGTTINQTKETSTASKTVTPANSEGQLTINLNNENTVKSKQLLNAVQNDKVAENISEDEKVTTQIQQINIRNTEILPEEYNAPEQLPAGNMSLNELEKQLNNTGFEDASTRKYVTEAVEYMKSLNTSNSNLVKKITEKEIAFIQNELTLQQQKSQLPVSVEGSIFSSDQLNQRLMLLENQLQQTINDKRLVEELQLLSGKKEREEQQKVVQLLNEKTAYLKKEITAAEEQLQEDRLSDQRLQELLEEYEELEAILVKMKKANAEQVVLYQLLQKEFKNLQQLQENEQYLKKQLQAAVSENNESKINDLTNALTKNKALRKQLEVLIGSNLQLLKNEINNPTLTYPSSSENTAVIQEKVAEMAFTLQPQQTVTADQIKTILESENYPKGLFYRIQVGAFAKPINENVYKDFSPVTMENLNKGLIKYMAGYFTEENTAATARDQIRKLGFTDAFIVAYCDGKRIPVFEARRLLKEGLCLPVSTQELLFHIDPTKQELLTHLNSSSPAGNAVTDNPPVKIEQKTALQMKSGYAVDVQSVEGLYFTVQVGVFNRYVEEEYLKGLKPVNTDEVAPKVIRFSVGIFDDLNKAKEQRLEAVQKGFTDAFIVAYYKGKRITVQEANLLLQQNKAELVRISEMKEQEQPISETSPIQEVNYVQVLKEEIQNSTVLRGQEIPVLPEKEGKASMEILLTSEELELPFYWWVIEHFENYFLQKTANGIIIHAFYDEEEKETLISDLESLGFENVQIKK